MSTHSSAALDRRALLLLGGASLVLASCGGSTKQAPIYILHPDIHRAPGGPPVTWELSVAVPYAAAGLNIDRIGLMRSAETLDYYADSNWTDRLPIVLQTCIVEAFEQSGRIKGVSREGSSLKADYALETEIRDFTAHYVTTDGAPAEAVVHINCKLVALPDRNIVGTFDSNQTAKASENSVAATVSAFNVALTAALKEIVDWTLTAPPAPPAAVAPAKPHPHRRRRRRKPVETEAMPEE